MLELFQMCCVFATLPLITITPAAADGESGTTTVHFYFNPSTPGLITRRNLTCGNEADAIYVSELTYWYKTYDEQSKACDVQCTVSNGYYEVQNLACKNQLMVRSHCSGRSSCRMGELKLEPPRCTNVGSFQTTLIAISYTCIPPNQHINLCERSTRNITSLTNNPVYVTGPTNTPEMRDSTCSCSIRVPSPQRFNLLLLDYWQILEREQLIVWLLDVESPHTFYAIGPSLLGRQFPYPERSKGFNLTLYNTNYMALGKSFIQLRLTPSDRFAAIQYTVTCNGGGPPPVEPSSMSTSPTAKGTRSNLDSDSPHQANVTIIVLSVLLTAVVVLAAGAIAVFVWRRRSKTRRTLIQYVRGESMTSSGNNNSSEVCTMKKPLVIEHTVRLRDETPLSDEKESMLEPGNYHTLEPNSSLSEPMYNEIDNPHYRHLCDASEPGLPMREHDGAAPHRVRRSVPYHVTDIVGKDHQHTYQPVSSVIQEDDNETNITPEGIYSEPLDVEIGGNYDLADDKDYSTTPSVNMVVNDIYRQYES